MDSALSDEPAASSRLRTEFGPMLRSFAARYFEPVRFPRETEADLRRLHERGFVVHVMRTTSWVNYLYLAWALVRRGLPPVRAVVNLRPWFTKPWRRTAQRGEFDVRFTYARRQQGAGLIFLKRSAFMSAHGRNTKEDPFPALVAMARRSERPVFLVPALFVWEKWSTPLRPRLIDFVFGGPEAPGFLHSLLAFWRNYQRAHFRTGEPIDLRQYALDHPGEPDAVVARKVRGVLYHHLARETRAVFGAPLKPAHRIIEETLRDRSLRRSLEEAASARGVPVEAVTKEARRNLRQIVARLHPSVVAVVAWVLNWVFHRIYDGVEVDEAGFQRSMRAASRAPLVMASSHKSHMDYLILGWVLWTRGYTAPLVAAGANLSFFPLGPILRRGGAYFLRRSFRGDKVYTATFKAYVRKLIHDGTHQEFFPEGGRSRTGKLMMPKLGLLTWQVEAVLEGARDDVMFVPVSIDYEKIVEAGSYSKELAGGEKKQEDLKALLAAPKVLTRNYGRIHLAFDQPISLAALMDSRGLSPKRPLTDEEKRNLVRALGNKIMYGIARACTLTPQALVAAALLAHPRRGVTDRELGDRVGLLRAIAHAEGARLSSALSNAPSDPTVLGPIHDAVEVLRADELLRIEQAKGMTVYLPVDAKRPQLSFYKNTLMNLLAPRALVATAVVSAGRATRGTVRDRALFLSRLFKFEFIYQVGVGFDAIFANTLVQLERAGLVHEKDGQLSAAPEPHALPLLQFLADLLRDFLESYLLTAKALEDVVQQGGLEAKALSRTVLETGRAEFLAGRISAAEALSKPSIDNAIQYLVDQRFLVEENRRLVPGPASAEPSAREALRRRIAEQLQRPGAAAAAA